MSDKITDFMPKAEEELKSFATRQQKILQETLLEVRKLREENAHLKLLLDEATKHIPVFVEKSSEQLICEFQIEMIKKDAMVRELDLDEVKRLDILIKNLRLIKEQSTAIVAESRKIPAADAELIELVKDGK